MNRQLWIAIALGLCVGCDAPAPAERVDAPSSPDEQLEALRAAADEAEAEARWARAEVAVETLAALEPEQKGHTTRLVIIRKRRRVGELFREVEDLILSGAFQIAEDRIGYLEERRLHDEDRATLETLREHLAMVRDIDENIDLPANPDEMPENDKEPVE